MLSKSIFVDILGCGADMYNLHYKFYSHQERVYTTTMMQPPRKTAPQNGKDKNLVISCWNKFLLRFTFICQLLMNIRLCLACARERVFSLAIKLTQSIRFECYHQNLKLCMQKPLRTINHDFKELTLPLLVLKIECHPHFAVALIYR